MGVSDVARTERFGDSVEEYAPIPFVGFEGELRWDDAVYGYDPASPDEPSRADSAPFVPRSVVVDVRGGRLFDQIEAAVNEVFAQGADLKILFLESSDEALVRRFESNRRPHPLQGGGRLLDAIHRERALLGNLRATADLVLLTHCGKLSDDAVQLLAALLRRGRTRRLPADGRRLGVDCTEHSGGAVE